MKKPAMKPVAKAAGPAKEKVVTKDKPGPERSVPGNLNNDERRWKTEDAMRTIMRAEELKKDKALMRDVGKMAKDQAAKLSGLCGKAK